MDRDYAVHYADLEKNHWWFRARRNILRDLLAREVAWPPDARVLEIGVGPGENLYTLYPPGARVQGLEPESRSVAAARARGPLPVHEGTIENMPEPLRSMSFDVITLFDVLEHIRDDAQALQLLYHRLQPGGFLVLSVPAYQCLWGLQDEVSYHFRRYRRSQLVARLRAAGFAVQRSSYFNSVLFPPIALFRVLARLRPRGTRKAESDFDYSPGFANSLLYTLFNAEKGWLRWMNFPFGVSIFAIARRPPAA